jgi:hypothetical protein
MSHSTIYTVLLVMDLAVFLIGLITFIAGVAILAFRVAGKEVQTLAVQTARLGQKGLAEDIAGLVGNASTLLDALNQLIRTTAGIAVFMAFFGLLTMAVAFWFGLQIYKMPL